MKYRIGAWATAGFLVAAFWAFYLYPSAQAGPTLTLARWTCPAMLAGSYFHFGLRFYWVVLVNAATYALLGLMIETSRLLKPSTQP